MYVGYSGTWSLGRVFSSLTSLLIERSKSWLGGAGPLDETAVWADSHAIRL